MKFIEYFIGNISRYVFSLYYVKLTYQRTPVCIPISYLNIREELTASHDQEIHIEEKLELLEEDQWNESNNIVFLIFDDIRSKFARNRLTNGNFSIT